MPSSLKNYKDKNKAKYYRNKQRSRNYRRGEYGEPNRRRRWLVKDESFIKESQFLTDRSIAQILKRSVRAVQQKRNELKYLQHYN
jgi:hypothetical protein